MQAEIVGFARNRLRDQASRRAALTDLIDWTRMREQIEATVRGAFSERIFRLENPLNSRVVSRLTCAGFRIENVLFESLPGWEVNASVYLPLTDGPYRPVICPTGHSTKTRDIYQRAAQTFARNGYAAFSFDPPGQQGEMQHLNDHFTNGLIGYLTGMWSNNHFVVDAIRCIDYAHSRPDIDCSDGVTMTGVSGGGKTSLYTSILDDRVSFLAPVCCIAERELVHLVDLYTACPEQFEPGFLRHGMDYIDMLALWAPRPCLIVGGAQDELWDHRSMRRLFEQTRRGGSRRHVGYRIRDRNVRRSSVPPSRASSTSRRTSPGPIPATRPKLSMSRR